MLSISMFMVFILTPEGTLKPTDIAFSNHKHCATVISQYSKLKEQDYLCRKVTVQYIND